MIQLNGQDGGGQILRTALSLSMITGQAFSMTHIRGKRSKPGLMRQHLTCVNAAKEICNAVTDGAEMHSTELVFQPNKINAGDYTFKIGSAGSTTLIFQTILPALMLLDEPSSIEIHGGTHNSMAPSADFIERSFLPQLRNMGVGVDFSCPKIGFAPAGGGIIQAMIKPTNKLTPLHLTERGRIISKRAEALLANVRKKVAEEEMKAVTARLHWEDECNHIRLVDNVDGAGNCLSLEIGFNHHTLHITSHGAFGKTAKKVASDGAKALTTFLKSEAAIGPRLADQLLLPIALAEEGSLKTISLTNHMKTNIRTIEAFLNVKFKINDTEPGGLRIDLLVRDLL